jgi:hypothetical protein
MTDHKIINITSVRRPAKFRGQILSSDYNDTQEEIISDIADLANVVNSLSSKLSKTILILNNENSFLRRKVDSLQNQQEYSERISTTLGSVVSRYVDLSSTEGISFPNDLDDTRSAMLSSEYGEVTLPVNSVENKFYVISLTTNKVISPGLNIVVNGSFDKQDGNGIVNYERGGQVTLGTPENAFNGVNELYWIRKVEFPLDSRVDQVECELTVIVPEGSSSNANLIELIPFPNGSVDITELAVASDLGNNFTRVSGFTPVNNLTAKRYHFTPTIVDQIKIRFRQRNWVEENGKKVFYYGLQECSLKLIDYDKQYVPGASFGTNNSFIITIPAPSGTSFNKIYSINPEPNFLLEDFSNRHVHIKLCSSPDTINNVLWDSDNQFPPQSSSVPITTNTDTLYAFVQMNFVDSSGGLLSPFKVGTTPFMHGLGLSYTLTNN